MAHSDDDGLVLPPMIAPLQVVIVPIYKTQEQLDAISLKVNEIKSELLKNNITVKFDNDEKQKPGWKFAEYEMKGVPVRIAIGPKDLENGTVEVARRDLKTKEIVSIDESVNYVEKLLNTIQSDMFNNAKKYRDSRIT